MTYKDFFDPDEVETFKRVKGGSMRIARSCRKVAADMVGGTLLKGGKKRSKEYVRTEVGMFRLAMSSNSDNPTEAREHHRLGAKIVVMSDDTSMGEFFDMHGLHINVALDVFRRRVREEVRGDEPPSPPIAGTPSRPFPPHPPSNPPIPGQLSLV